MAWYIIQILVFSQCVVENGKVLLDDVGGSRRSNPKDRPVIDSADIILFDMENDERETKNLSQKYPEVVEAMKKKLADYVNNGRSTPGVPVLNDTGGKIVGRALAIEGLFERSLAC